MYESINLDWSITTEYTKQIDVKKNRSNDYLGQREENETFAQGWLPRVLVDTKP